MLRNEPANGYRRMTRYIYMLNTVNPNSNIRMHKSPKTKLMYHFIALYLMMWHFEFCRLVVVVDVAYLSGVYKEIFV